MLTWWRSRQRYRQIRRSIFEGDETTVLRLLLADPTPVKEVKSNLPLVALAAHFGLEQVCRAFLDRGAERLRPGSSERALERASEAVHIDIMRMFLSRDVSLGRSIKFAGIAGSVEGLELLHMHGARPEDVLLPPISVERLPKSTIDWLERHGVDVHVR